MIRFLSNVLEQLDVALDRLVLSDPNYKRFAFMLINNMEELTVHQHGEASAGDTVEFGRFSEPRPVCGRRALA